MKHKAKEIAKKEKEIKADMVTLAEINNAEGEYAAQLAKKEADVKK